MTDTPAEVAEALDCVEGHFNVEVATTLRAHIAELERQLAEASAVTDMLMLCGEREVRDVEGFPDKLRALIDGLIGQRRRADDAERQLAEARECIDNLKYRRETADAFGEQCMADIADLQSQLAAQRERDGRDALPFTDATIDKLQSVMALHGFAVPVRVISDAFRTAIDATLKDRP